MDARCVVASRACCQWTIAWVAFTCFAMFVSGTAAAADLLAARSDAYVRVAGAEEWLIGNRQIQMLVDARSGDLQIARLARADSGTLWPSSAAEALVTIDGRSLRLGRSGGFALSGATASPTQVGVQLDLTFVRVGTPLHIIRHYAVCPGSPIVEMWTSFFTTARSFTVSRMDVWQMTIPAGRVHWVNG